VFIPNLVANCTSVTLCREIEISRIVLDHMMTVISFF
jgi:hypothetical protein